MSPPPPRSTLFPYTTLFRSLEIPDSRSSPESAFLQSERNRVLSAAMNKLTPGIRTAIELRDLGELYTKEVARSEEHTSELQSLRHLVCRLLLEKKKKKNKNK